VSVLDIPCLGSGALLNACFTVDGDLCYAPVLVDVNEDLHCAHNNDIAVLSLRSVLSTGTHRMPVESILAR
jgi:hypothetical protein